MALVLSLRKTQDFYVGTERFVMEVVHSEKLFRVRRESTGQTFEISDTTAIEVMDEVFVSAGDDPPPQTARIVISAPRNIRVLRGEKYRNPPPGVRGAA
jgi:hypothetical protein